MTVILLGIGLQGKAALFDLVHNSTFEKVVAIDGDQGVVEWAKENFCNSRVEVRRIDISNGEKVYEVFQESGKGIVIDLLPIQFISSVAEASVKAGFHYINTFYIPDELYEISRRAEEGGLTVLPEFGLDPGIDLVLAGRGLSTMDVVTDFFSYGAGIPEPVACTNPLNYKISWTFDGVLACYNRLARIIEDGKEIEIPARDIFDERWQRIVSVGSVGELECHPNGDITQYVQRADLRGVRNAGRYTMRWPGHNRFWNIISKFGLLEDTPIVIDGKSVSKQKVVSRLLEPHLHYGDKERDMAILKVEIIGEKDTKKVKHIYEMVDYRDLDTGFFAMSRTVGFVASIGAQMISNGSIKKRGLCDPMRDVPYGTFIKELGKRNIKITER
jgi:lysine 6-dehydrogenase